MKWEKDKGSITTAGTGTGQNQIKLLVLLSHTSLFLHHITPESPLRTRGNENNTSPDDGSAHNHKHLHHLLEVS
jgi:hypothetical protein